MLLLKFPIEQIIHQNSKFTKEPPTFGKTMVSGRFPIVWVKQCHFYHPWLGMVTIPPIKMVMTGWWFIVLPTLYQLYVGYTQFYMGYTWVFPYTNRVNQSLTTSRPAPALLRTPPAANLGHEGRCTIRRTVRGRAQQHRTIFASRNGGRKCEKCP